MTEPIYKISYVVRGENHPGAIVAEVEKPRVGDKVTLGDRVFQIVEVVDLLPARGDFNFLHVTVEAVPQ